MHATRTHTPFRDSLHAWISRRTQTLRMSRHYRVSTNATRADCTHAIHYCTSCTKIDDRYYFRNEQIPNPLPPKRPVFVSKKISVITDDPLVDICFIVFGSLPLFWLRYRCQCTEETYCTYRECYDIFTCWNPACTIPVLTYTLWYPEFNLETCKYVFMLYPGHHV